MGRIQKYLADKFIPGIEPGSISKNKSEERQRNMKYRKGKRQKGREKWNGEWGSQGKEEYGKRKTVLRRACDSDSLMNSWSHSIMNSGAGCAVRVVPSADNQHADNDMSRYPPEQSCAVLEAVRSQI